MSFDMFVQRFSNGDAAPMAAEVFWAVFGPHVERPEPELDFWRARVADGGEADIYAGVAGPSLDSLMISRFSTGTVLELLVEFVRRAGAVIMPPGCPTLLIDEKQARELPEELRADVAVVSSGSDIEAILLTEVRGLAARQVVRDPHPHRSVHRQ